LLSEFSSFLASPDGIAILDEALKIFPANPSKAKVVSTDGFVKNSYFPSIPNLIWANTDIARLGKVIKNVEKVYNAISNPPPFIKENLNNTMNSTLSAVPSDIVENIADKVYPVQQAALEGLKLVIAEFDKLNLADSGVVSPFDFISYTNDIILGDYYSIIIDLVNLLPKIIKTFPDTKKGVPPEVFSSLYSVSAVVIQGADYLRCAVSDVQTPRTGYAPGTRLPSIPDFLRANLDLYRIRGVIHSINVLYQGGKSSAAMTELMNDLNKPSSAPKRMMLDGFEILDIKDLSNFGDIVGNYSSSTDDILEKLETLLSDAQSANVPSPFDLTKLIRNILDYNFYRLSKIVRNKVIFVEHIQDFIPSILNNTLVIDLLESLMSGSGGVPAVSSSSDESGSPSFDSQINGLLNSFNVSSYERQFVLALNAAQDLENYKKSHALPAAPKLAPVRLCQGTPAITYKVTFDVTLSISLEYAKKNEQGFILVVAKTLTVPVTDVSVIWAVASGVTAQVLVQNIKSKEVANVIVGVVDEVSKPDSKVLLNALVAANALKPSDTVTVKAAQSVEVKAEVLPTATAESTTPKPSSDSSVEGNKEGPLGAGAIVAIVFGVLLVVGIIGFVVYRKVKTPFKLTRV